ncbi:hypothetical protein KJ966_16400 [bacterium]|nr:hypothetical protein [bacterium]
MSYSQKDVERSLAFAERVRLTATLDTADNRSILFHQSEEIPKDLNEEVRILLDIAVKYYQRSIFTGEYLMEDDDPPVRRTGEPIDDINFFLGYYKTKLIEELKKAFDLDEQMKIKSDGPKITPYAMQMLKYRKEMAKKAKQNSPDKSTKK